MKYAINLFPDTTGTLLERVTYFAYYYIRYILVFAQLIVVLVFFYRFKVDQDIIDLKDTLSQKEEIVDVAKDLMSEASMFEKKISFARGIMDEQSTFKNALAALFRQFPGAAKLNRFDISDKTIQLEGISTDPDIIRDYYLILSKSPEFKDATIQGIKKAENGYTFVITVSI